MGSRVQRGLSWTGWLLLAPALAILVLVVIIPIGLAVKDSRLFLNLSVPHRVGQAVGDQHYRELVHDPDFHRATSRTLRFACEVTLGEAVLGVLLALWIHGFRRKSRRALETCLLIPLLSAPVMVGFAWLLLLQPNYGLIPWLLELRVPLLARKAPFTVRLVDIWQWTPVFTLLSLSALEAVPRSLNEAAQLDCLGRWARFRAFEWRYLMPVVAIVSLLRFLEAFKVYDTIAILTGGGPGNLTEFLSLFLKRTAFEQNRFGYGAAATLVLDYWVILAAAALFFVLERRRKEPL